MATFSCRTAAVVLEYWCFVLLFVVMQIICTWNRRALPSTPGVDLAVPRVLLATAPSSSAVGRVYFFYFGDGLNIARRFPRSLSTPLLQTPAPRLLLFRRIDRERRARAISNNERTTARATATTRIQFRLHFGGKILSIRPSFVVSVSVCREWDFLKFIFRVTWTFIYFILFYFIYFFSRGSAAIHLVDCRKRATLGGCSCWRRINLDDRFDFIFTPFDVFWLVVWAGVKVSGNRTRSKIGKWHKFFYLFFFALHLINGQFRDSLLLVALP